MHWYSLYGDWYDWDSNQMVTLWCRPLSTTCFLYANLTESNTAYFFWFWACRPGCPGTRRKVRPSRQRYQLSWNQVELGWLGTWGRPRKERCLKARPTSWICRFGCINTHLLLGFSNISDVLESEVVIGFHLFANLSERVCTSSHSSLVIALSWRPNFSIIKLYIINYQHFQSLSNPADVRAALGDVTNILGRVILVLLQNFQPLNL